MGTRSGWFTGKMLSRFENALSQRIGASRHEQRLKECHHVSEIANAIVVLSRSGIALRGITARTGGSPASEARLRQNQEISQAKETQREEIQREEIRPSPAKTTETRGDEGDKRPPFRWMSWRPGTRQWRLPASGAHR